MVEVGHAEPDGRDDVPVVVRAKLEHLEGHVIVDEGQLNCLEGKRVKKYTFGSVIVGSIDKCYVIVKLRISCKIDIFVFLRLKPIDRYLSEEKE